MTGWSATAVKPHLVLRSPGVCAGRWPAGFQVLIEPPGTPDTRKPRFAGPLRIWRARQDSNLRPLPSEGSTLSS